MRLSSVHKRLLGVQPFTYSRCFLYFPHVATSIPWQTEIAIINTSDQTVTGTLKGIER